MDINQVGIMLAYKRTKDNISMHDLCEGICDRSFYNRLEQGKRGCEKIVAEALLQRVGFASDRFVYFLDTEEYVLLKVREDLLCSIISEEFEEAERYYKKYEMLSANKSVLHHQLLLFSGCILQWRKELSQGKKTNYSTLEQMLSDAWNITRANYGLDAECPRYMGFVELLIKCFYFRLQEEKGQVIDVLNGYENILSYIDEKMDERDKATFYIHIAYRMLCLMNKMQLDTEQKQECLYQNCMTFLKRQGRMTLLVELLEYRISYLKRMKRIQASEDIQKEKGELKRAVQIIDWLYKTYEINIKEWSWYLPIGMEEVIPLSEAIKGRRQSLGWTQEKLAEGICNPVTISRIETGISNCRLGKLGALMNKLLLPGGTAVLAIQTGRFELYEKMLEVERLSIFSRFNELAPLLKELKHKSVHDRYMDQYIMMNEGRINYLSGTWDVDKHWEVLREALYMTVPVKRPADLERWSFTKTEVNIINGFTYGCKKKEKMEEAIQWLQVLREYYERQVFSYSHYIRGYEMTLRNLGDLLGNEGKYEEAIAYEDIAIRLALHAEKTNVLRITIYDRAWNMEHLWGEGYTKEESRLYMEAALLLNKLYSKPESIAHVEKHWEKFYS